MDGKEIRRSAAAGTLSRRGFLLKALGIGAAVGVSALGLDLLLSSEQPQISTTPATRTKPSTQTSNLTTNSTTTPTTSPTTTSSSQSSAISPFNGDWSLLRDACYRYAAVRLHPDQPLSSDPSYTFPLMKSLGFNLARVGIDWQYIDAQPSVILPILDSLASYADASGIYIGYLPVII